MFRVSGHDPSNVETLACYAIVWSMRTLCLAPADHVRLAKGCSFNDNRVSHWTTLSQESSRKRRNGESSSLAAI